jgi:dihydroorotase
MIKEAMVEAIPNKKIILGLTTDWDSAKLVEFKDGNMYLYTTPGYFYLYLSYYSGFDVTKVL